jgi:thioredoxin 1
MDQEELKREQERVKELIESRKKAKAIELEMETLDKEKQRRNDAKLMHETQLKHNDEAKKREIDVAKKAKAKDDEYSQQLKEQIRRDREERLNRSGPVPASGPAAPVVAAAPAPTTSSSTSQSANAATLKIRLADGLAVTEVFEASVTLAEVRAVLKEKHNLKGSLYLRQSFPARTFEDSDNNKTMKELGLVPNAALTVVSEESIGKPNATTASASSESWSGWSWNLMKSFFGYGAEPAQQSPSTFSSMPGKFKGGHVHHIHSAQEFNEAKTFKGLLAVDFSAVWCGPCKIIAPTFESLAKSNPSSLFIHVDIDELRGTHSDLEDVRSVPTFKFFKGGKLVHSFSGASTQQLESAVQRYR